MTEGFVSPLIHKMNEHIHSVSKVYPTLDDGVEVAGAAGAWTLGDFVQIVPVNTIASPFDIHWISIENCSAEDVYELALYAATTEIGRVRFSASITVGLHPILPPIKFQCAIIPANTQIQAKAANAGGGAESVTISIHYHTY